MLLNCTGHILRTNCVLKQVIEGKPGERINTTIKTGIRRKQLQNNLKEMTAFWKSKEEALDLTLTRTCFGRGNGPVIR